MAVVKKCEIVSCDDIGDVLEEDVDEEHGIVSRVVEGEIDAVLSCEGYESCMGCKSKVIIRDGVIGECSKCGMMQKIKKCRKLMTAKVIVSTVDGKSHVLTMFDEVVTSLIDGVSGESLDLKLLAVPVKRFHVDRKDVVYSVSNVIV